MRKKPERFETVFRQRKVNLKMSSSDIYLKKYFLAFYVMK